MKAVKDRIDMLKRELSLEHVQEIEREMCLESYHQQPLKKSFRPVSAFPLKKKTCAS